MKDEPSYHRAAVCWLSVDVALICPVIEVCEVTITCYVIFWFTAVLVIFTYMTVCLHVHEHQLISPDQEISNFFFVIIGM